MRAVRGLAQAVCRGGGRAEAQGEGWADATAGGLQLSRPAEEHAREMMRTVQQVAEGRRRGGGRAPEERPRAAPVSAEEERCEETEHTDNAARRAAPTERQEGAEREEEEAAPAEPARGAAPMDGCGGGAERITGRVDIGCMAHRTRRPTTAAPEGVRDVEADRATPLGAPFVIPYKRGGWSSERGGEREARRDERYRPLVVRAAAMMMQELEADGQSDAARIAREGPEGSGWRIEGQPIGPLPTHQEAIGRDPHGHGMWNARLGGERQEHETTVPLQGDEAGRSGVQEVPLPTARGVHRTGSDETDGGGRRGASGAGGGGVHGGAGQGGGAAAASTGGSGGGRAAERRRGGRRPQPAGLPARATGGRDGGSGSDERRTWKWEAGRPLGGPQLVQAIPRAARRPRLSEQRRDPVAAHTRRGARAEHRGGAGSRSGRRE